MKSAIKAVYKAILVDKILFNFEDDFYKLSLEAVLKDMGVKITRKAKTK